MTYSGAIFSGDASKSLEDAQAAKYKRILDKLHAMPGDHILEIGCGWGGFAEMAARQGCKVTALTLSKNQATYAQQRLAAAGLNHLTSVELTDYREIDGSFDHIVSIGMFEHVGERYWPVYFKTLRKLLKPRGRAMVQSIMLDDHLFEELHDYSGFLEHYIFPGGMLPSKKRFTREATRAGLDCREMFAFGSDYAITLTKWLERFEAQKTTVRLQGYDESFIRLWRYYLASCIASFTSRRIDVVQVELTCSAT